MEKKFVFHSMETVRMILIVLFENSSNNSLFMINDFVLVFIKIYVSFPFEAEWMSLQLIRISYKTSIVACVVKKGYERL